MHTHKTAITPPHRISPITTYKLYDGSYEEIYYPSYGTNFVFYEEEDVTDSYAYDSGLTNLPGSILKKRHSN